MGGGVRNWAICAERRWAIWEQYVGPTRCSPPSYVADRDSELDLGFRFQTLITGLNSPLPGSIPWAWIPTVLSPGFVSTRGGPWFTLPIGPIRNLPTKLSVSISLFSFLVPHSFQISSRNYKLNYNYKQFFFFLYLVMMCFVRFYNNICVWISCWIWIICDKLPIVLKAVMKWWIE